MAFCECGHPKEQHGDIITVPPEYNAGMCKATVQVVHEGQSFIRRCGCVRYREDRPRTLKEITPEELLHMPMTTPHYM